MPPCILQTVIVNLKDDPNVALHGVLFGVRGRWLILKNASILQASEAPKPADGELLIPAANVAFIQASVA